MGDEARRRAELSPTAAALGEERNRLRATLQALASSGSTPQGAADLRAAANSLALRATQAALTAAKGAGFLRSHPAQRWARQALFFLVWSCPRPAVEATLALPGSGRLLTLTSTAPLLRLFIVSSLDLSVLFT